MDDVTKKLFDAVDSKKDAFIQRLSDWVAIKSISCQADTRPETIRMVHFVKEEFEKLGAKMEICENPNKTEFFPDGQELQLPPICLGVYPAVEMENKKTILIYGHVDVQPAKFSDGWDTEPFVLTEKDGKLYGRGSTDDKGPVLGWLLILETMQELGIECPVNLRFCFEGMEEVDSSGLDDLIFKVRNDFFCEGIDGTCISDNYWLGTEKPCLTYGLRGIACFSVTVECAASDLHSGIFGGTVREAMTDLIQIMGSLVNGDGSINIEGINDEVDPVTQAEMETYKPIDFCIEEFKKCHSVNLLHDTKERTLQGRWRYPSLSLHGIEGAFADPGEKTVIPRRVIGKFSIRMVPSMTGEAVISCVEKHVEMMKAKLNTPNKVWLNCSGADKPWFGAPNGFLYEAGKIATKNVYGVDPDMTREGGSIPVTLSFQEATKNPVILIPMGAGDDGAHGQNEKINIKNYIGGIKLFGSFLHELGKQ